MYEFEWLNNGKSCVERKFCDYCNKIKDIDKFAKIDYSVSRWGKGKNICKSCEQKKQTIFATKINKINRNYLKTNPQYKQACYIANYLNRILSHRKRGIILNTTPLRLLYCGASVMNFLNHIESIFLPGMNWQNYGRRFQKDTNGWSVDHIIPKIQFDLTKIEDIKKCCTLANIQPMWLIDNMKKNSTILNKELLIKFK